MPVTTTPEESQPVTPVLEAEDVGKSLLPPNDHPRRKPSIGDTPGVHENPLTGAKYEVRKGRQHSRIWLRSVTPGPTTESSKPETTVNDVEKNTYTPSERDREWEASLYKGNVPPKEIWLRSWGGSTLDGSSKETIMSYPLPSPSDTMTGDDLLRPSIDLESRRDSAVSVDDDNCG